MTDGTKVSQKERKAMSKHGRIRRRQIEGTMLADSIMEYVNASIKRGWITPHQTDCPGGFCDCKLQFTDVDSELTQEQRIEVLDSDLKAEDGGAQCR